MMNKSAYLFLWTIAIIAVITMIAGAFYFLQNERDVQKQENGVDSNIINSPIKIEKQAPPSQPLSPQNTEPQELTVQQKFFTIEADDSGFYSNEKKISFIEVEKDKDIEITLKVRKNNVYNGGLDFRGNGIKTGSVKPGNSILFSFKAESDFDIKSYWPASSVLKDTLSVRVL